MDTRLDEVIARGSKTYEYKCGALTHGTLYWYNLGDIFPEGRAFIPFDSIEVNNNSGAILTLYLNSISEPFTIPAYMIKPIARRPFRQLGIKNVDAAIDTAADEVILHVRRLPPNVQVVVSSGTLR